MSSNSNNAMASNMTVGTTPGVSMITDSVNTSGLQ